MGVYLWTEQQGWQPGANTIAYYPLKSDGDEASGKSGLDITTTGITFSDNVAVLDGNQRATAPNITGWKTISFWYNENSDNVGMPLAKDVDHWIQFINGVVYFAGTSRFNITTNASKQNWHLLTIAQSVTNNSGASTSGTNLILYIDAVQKGVQNNAYLNWSLYALGWSGNSGYPYSFKGKMSELIFESSQRTAQEIEDYYDLTKGDYGIS